MDDISHISASLCHGWDLDDYAIQGSLINQVIIWRSKAFLCVPRISKQSSATLLKAPWPEKLYSNLHPALAFPGLKMQTPGCRFNILSAVSGDIDDRGRLFILDVGFGTIGPKIVVFDLLRGNHMIARSFLNGLSGSSLHRLVVDPVPAEPLAYISDADHNRLIVYNLEDCMWWPVYLTVKNPIYGSLTHSICSDLAVLTHKDYLYITSESTDDMFVMSLEAIRDGDGPPPIQSNSLALKIYNTTLRNVGIKLGKSKGLIADWKDAVHYFLTDFHATVKWDAKRPLSAEAHTITLQSADLLPTVTSFFQDEQKQIWAVIDPHAITNTTAHREPDYHKTELHCVKIQNYKMQIAGKDFLN